MQVNYSILSRENIVILLNWNKRRGKHIWNMFLSFFVVLYSTNLEMHLWRWFLYERTLSTSPKGWGLFLWEVEIRRLWLWKQKTFILRPRDRLRQQPWTSLCLVCVISPSCFSCFPNRIAIPTVSLRHSFTFPAPSLGFSNIESVLRLRTHPSAPHKKSSVCMEHITHKSVTAWQVIAPNGCQHAEMWGEHCEWRSETRGE